MNLYRARYEYPDGRTAAVTFVSLPCDALRWAADYCRCIARAYLLELQEELPAVQQFRLVP